MSEQNRRANDPMIQEIRETVIRLEGKLDGKTMLDDVIQKGLVDTCAQNVAAIRELRSEMALADNVIKSDFHARQTVAEEKVRKLEDWSLITKVAAFLGAGGTLGGIGKILGLM